VPRRSLDLVVVFFRTKMVGRPSSLSRRPPVPVWPPPHPGVMPVMGRLGKPVPEKAPVALISSRCPRLRPAPLRPAARLGCGGPLRRGPEFSSAAVHFRAAWQPGHIDVNRSASVLVAAQFSFPPEGGFFFFFEHADLSLSNVELARHAGPPQVFPFFPFLLLLPAPPCGVLSACFRILLGQLGCAAGAGWSGSARVAILGCASPEWRFWRPIVPSFRGRHTRPTHPLLVRLACPFCRLSFLLRARTGACSIGRLSGAASSINGKTGRATHGQCRAESPGPNPNSAGTHHDGLLVFLLVEEDPCPIPRWGPQWMPPHTTPGSNVRRLGVAGLAAAGHFGQKTTRRTIRVPPVRHASGSAWGRPCRQNHPSAKQAVDMASKQAG